ncbi:hypothetical protein V1J52_07770 [Streptomyces sp. TRM 70351]|uniref:hypothetical protein n=1 Tax=Streptomyces sp. TRM 70351 TaxID=3116552 RepID=UPI002E7C2F02|nr:hypothetical protein [Streptomyces sp. TRM 70351]MEE1928093.1 hypothetical protein [Streptomyces sp. TRM 70351]
MRRTVAEADDAIEADWTDRRSLLTALSHYTGVPRASVFGFDAAGALAAAWANALLRLPGNPPSAVQGLIDPVTQRELVNRFTAFPVRAEVCVPHTLSDAARRIGFPCVVRTRAQRRHTLLGPDDADGLAARLPARQPLVVEERLTGPVFEVGAHSYGGAHTVHTLTPDGVGARTAHAVTRAATTALDALDHRVGLAHATVVLTPRGPRLRAAAPGPGAAAGSAAPYALAVAAVLDLARPAHRAAVG